MTSSAPPGPPPGPQPGPPGTPPPPPRRSSGGLRSVLPGVVIGVLVFAVVAAGVVGVVGLRDDGDGTNGTASSPSTAQPSAGDLPTPPAALRRFYEQKLAWKACDADLCSTMEVPLDYAHPDGRTIELALLKVPASGKRVGSLVVNPGGPGGSGVDYAKAAGSAWTKPLLRSFDIVGFDPRGVGKSTPLECAGTATVDALIASDPDPDTAAERRSSDRALHDFGEDCLSRSGALVRHMSTREVARDLDVLRQLLGQRRLDYFGASYGTFIGATYADLFPTHVGRMVLDGAVDPALSAEQVSRTQAHAFEVALRAYVADCVEQAGCPLGTTVEEGTRRVRQFLADVERTPLRTSGSRELEAGNAVLGIWLPLYVKSYWPVLTQALTQAIEKKDGSTLLALSDSYVSRGPSGYKDNSFAALYAVNCLDDDAGVPIDQVPRHYAEFEKASPTFGRIFAYGLSNCTSWPVHSGRTSRALHAQGAPPVVVVGTTRDPATPLAWARGLAGELDSGRLIVRDGDGHTGFNQGNECVDSAVEEYLVRGMVPDDGLRC